MSRDSPMKQGANVVTFFILVQVRLYREGLEQHFAQHPSIAVVGSAPPRPRPWHLSARWRSCA
jgi:hypothetical protein